MKEIRWDKAKNEQLKKIRGISFDQLLDARFIVTEEGRSKSHQKLMIFEFRRYAWVVPYVEGDDHYFLKTAFPSRKHTKRYLRRDHEKD